MLRNAWLRMSLPFALAGCALPRPAPPREAAAQPFPVPDLVVCAYTPEPWPGARELLDHFLSARAPFLISETKPGGKFGGCDLVVELSRRSSLAARAVVSYARSGARLSELEAAGTVDRLAETLSAALRMRLRESPDVPRRVLAERGAAPL